MSNDRTTRPRAASYVRETDGKRMVEIAPHVFVEETARRSIGVMTSQQDEPEAKSAPFGAELR